MKIISLWEASHRLYHIIIKAFSVQFFKTVIRKALSVHTLLKPKTLATEPSCAHMAQVDTTISQSYSPQSYIFTGDNKLHPEQLKYLHLFC